jgi:protein-S-isoprenylcysteine O-methyltransferase
MQLRPFPFSAGPVVALIFWSVFASWILPEVIAWRAKRSTDSTKARDRSSLTVISILWWGGIAMDYSFSLLLPQAALPWRRAPLFFAGISMMLLGIALRWYSAAVLGKYFTFDVAIQSGQILIEAGPYRYIRHPSYSGALLTLFGFGLALGNWAGLAAALVCLGSAYAYRIPVLGDAYEQYMKRTRRLLPFLY